MFYAIYKVLRSFIFAFVGIFAAFRERNMRVHGIAAVTVICAGAFFQISVMEWLWIITLIAAVFAAEIINTAVEDMSNILRDELGVSYKRCGKARDLAAGAVLVLAIAAAVGGVVIFGPRVWGLIVLS